MLVTIDWIKKNYDRFNKEFWGGRLPSVIFKINNSEHTWGYAAYRFNLKNNTVTPISITMSNFHDSPEEVKINTLLHEMIHIADYTFHPEHFIRNGRIVSKRSYDAHGYIFFLPEARRINAFGYKIAPKIQGWEEDASTLSASNQQRLSSKMAKGMKILLLHLTPQGDSYHGKYGTWCYVKVDNGHDIKWKNMMNGDWFKKTYDKAVLYISHDSHFANMRSTSSGAAHYCSMDVDAFIQKYGLQYNETLYDMKSAAMSLWEENNGEAMAVSPIENKRAVKMLNDFEGVVAIV